MTEGLTLQIPTINEELIFTAKLQKGPNNKLALLASFSWNGLNAQAYVNFTHVDPYYHIGHMSEYIGKCAERCAMDILKQIEDKIDGEEKN